jgi:hypothetical protein|tara:strand:- start:228 stop:968 length:741 start_codon:yes stop_codon:yes gene_type:complete
MAKQIINVGTIANDGTGDPIRSAMTKTNENFTEVYGLIDDIVIPSVPTDLTDLGITDGTVGQVLTTDGDGAFTFTTDAPNFDNTDVDAHLNTGTAAASQILSWTGSDYDWIAAPSGSGSGLQTRQSPSTTTASLANNASGNIDIVGYKTYALLSIITNKAAWVRIYATTAARAADASRSQSTDPAPDAGVIAEVITAGAETVLVSPGVIGYNMESTPTTSVPCAVTNLSGSTGTVFVSLNLLQLEA